MDLICFSHLRWNFVYQRPQHLLSRFANIYRVMFIEEPIFDSDSEYLDIKRANENLWIIVPHLSSHHEQTVRIQALLADWAPHFGITRYIAWLYTPMALPLMDALPLAELIIYDCMDELAAFKNAPAELREFEKRLLAKADLVFTGGYSLYEAKKDLHPDIYPFPSSIDRNHFAKARSIIKRPSEYFTITHPRIGFFGVVDERLDTELLGKLAMLKPDWQFIIIGPVVKIDPAGLPGAPNIHYMGSRAYEDLPHHLACWDVALIPFADNESTKFISPTKTPEYLAGGIPVVSTPIRDVVRPYGDMGLTYIAASAEDFIKGIEWGLQARHDPAWLKKVDDFLADISWDHTWLQMTTRIKSKLVTIQKHETQKEDEYV